jgi:hypothetical protein
MVTLRRRSRQDAAANQRNSLRGNDMTTLVENPMPVILFGIIAEAVLATLLVSTRQGAFIWAMLGVLVLVLAGVALEMLVETEVERVEATLDGAVDALEDNDVTRLLEQYVSTRAMNTRRRAITAMEMVEITSAKISGVDISINRLTSPPTADARFRGVVHFEPQTEWTHRSWYPADFIVKLRLEEDRWLITDHVEVSEIGSAAHRP